MTLNTIAAAAAAATKTEDLGLFVVDNRQEL